MNTTAFNDLARRISNQEVEVQKLRREFDERQRKLASLTKRKEDLQAQLRQIEAESAALVTGMPKKSTVGPLTRAKTTKSQPAKNAKSSSPKSPAPSRNSTGTTGLTLAALILRLIQEAPIA